MSEPRGPDPVLDALKLRLRRFAAEQDWDQFHSPRNLAAALIVEAAELVEHVQWLTGAESVAGWSRDRWNATVSLSFYTC